MFPDCVLWINLIQYLQEEFARLYKFCISVNCIIVTHNNNV